MNPACGFPLLPHHSISTKALEIAFSTLKYHRASDRKLTIKEYEAIRRQCPGTMHLLHKYALYIVDDKKLSALFVISENEEMTRICGLSDLISSTNCNKF